MILLMPHVDLRHQEYMDQIELSMPEISASFQFGPYILDDVDQIELSMPEISASFLATR